MRWILLAFTLLLAGCNAEPEETHRIEAGTYIPDTDSTSALLLGTDATYAWNTKLGCVATQTAGRWEWAPPVLIFTGSRKTTWNFCLVTADSALVEPFAWEAKKIGRGYFQTEDKYLNVTTWKRK